MPYHFDPLGAQDMSFLMYEHRNTPMHVAAVTVFERGPLGTDGGGVDIERIRKFIESRLDEIPRYRQKIRHTPISGRPVWVDDERFEINYHVRHVALPRPGSEQDLKHVLGRVVEKHLDRERPLWEMWIIEGLEDDRFAVFMKIHHCMVDGASGMHLAQLLFQLEDVRDFSPASRWLPRPAPSRPALIVEELRERNTARSALARFTRNAIRHPVDTVGSVMESAGGVLHALEDALHPRADAPLNGPVGAHRRCDWLAVQLDEIRAARKHHGATVNDFALAALAGGLRSFLQAREWEPDGRDFRVCMPVAVRNPNDDFSQANSVSALFLSLPIDESDPVRRLHRVEAGTEHLKQSGASDGTDLLLRLGDATHEPLVTRLGVGIANAARPFNLIVTNVRGPETPLYLLGARMQALVPMVPLFADQGLGIAIASYCGSLNFGISADWGLMPDVQRLRSDIEAAVEELVLAANPTAAGG